jgi:hypothetical protein
VERARALPKAEGSKHYEVCEIGSDPATMLDARLIDTLLPQLQGWCSPYKGHRLAAWAFESPTPLCVELGVFGGRGLLALAVGLKGRRAGQAHGIDPYTAAAQMKEGTPIPMPQEMLLYWRDLDYEAVMRGAEDGLRRGDLQDVARIIRKRSQDAAGDYQPETVGVLHQDGNHTEEVSSDEVARWTPLLHPSGVWVIDDYHWPTTQRAQRLLRDRGFVMIERCMREGTDAWAAYQRPR